MKTIRVLLISLSLAAIMLQVGSCRKDPEIVDIDDNPYPKPTPYNLIIPKGLSSQPYYIPIDNPLTVEGVKLGRFLFYDSILSEDYTISCGSCHKQEYAFSDGGKRFSEGVRKQLGIRNSMTLFNLAFQRGGLFWDGREPTLEQQILKPVEDHLEMNLLWTEAIQRISKREEYVTLYKIAFRTDVITKENIAKAIAQFLRTIVSGDSKFDRGEFTMDEAKGRLLFLSQPTFSNPRNGDRDLNTGLDCIHCHKPPLFQPEEKLNPFMNNGTDIGRFRVPSMRNIHLSYPYMHDGRIASLSDVLKHYNNVKVTPELDPSMWPKKHARTDSVTLRLNITTTEVNQVLAFLRTLNDDSLLVKKEYSNPFRK